MKLPKVAIKYALLQFFYYFNFFWLIQNIYFLNNGINFKQLSILLGIWSLSIIVFEIPSGILADKWGRKPIIVIGKLAFPLGIVSFVLFKNFPGFILGMILWGIHESFISGALEALVYDELKTKNQESRYKKVFSIATVSREIGLGSGVLIAGVITQIDINYNLIGSIIIAIVGLLIACLLPNPKAIELSEETSFYKFFKVSYKTIVKDVNLKKLVFFTLCVLVSYQVISEYFIVSLKALNLNYTIIGFMAFLEMLFFSIGASIAHRAKKPAYNKLYFILSVGMACGALLVTTRDIYIVIGAWMLLRVVKAISEIVSNSDWQESITSSDRATITSIKSFVGNIIYVPLAFAFGALADSHGLFNAFYLIAIASIVYVAVETISRLKATRY